MNKDDIARLARQAGLDMHLDPRVYPNLAGQLNRFAELVGATEREECARLCEDIEAEYHRSASDSWEFYLPTEHEADLSRGAAECAHAIRRRQQSAPVTTEKVAASKRSPAPLTDDSLAESTNA